MCRAINWICFEILLSIQGIQRYRMRRAIEHRPCCRHQQLLPASTVNHHSRCAIISICLSGWFKLKYMCRYRIRTRSYVRRTKKYRWHFGTEFTRDHGGRTGYRYRYQRRRRKQLRPGPQSPLRRCRGWKRRHRRRPFHGSSGPSLLQGKPERIFQ